MRIKLLLFIYVLMLPAPYLGAEWHQFSDTAMTTPIELEMWSENARHAETVSKLVFAEFNRIESMMTRYRNSSELSKVNRTAARQPVSISNDLFFVIEQAQKVSRLSAGAFDITFASAGYLYDFRAALQPSGTELSKHVSAIDYRNVLLNEPKQTIRFKQQGVMIDLGGIAKGFAVDQGIRLLDEQGVRHARLSAGGDMRLLGDKRGKPWIVGIKDPRSDDEHVVALPLADVSVSTSGDYERFFIDETGKRIHHILSPETGKPAQGIQSVTVIGPDTITTDGLSTAIFVLGVEKGLKMIARLEGIDVIIIDAERKVHFSDGLMPPENARE